MKAPGRGATVVILCSGVLAALAGCSTPQHAGPTAISRPLASTSSPAAKPGSAGLAAVAHGVSALWQGAPWIDLTFAGPDLLGIDVETNRLHAIRAATGAPLWTATMPKSAPLILGLLPAGNVVVVAAGHNTGPFPIGYIPVVSAYVALDRATGKRLWATTVGGDYQSPPAAVSGKYLLTGDVSGAVTARNVATGAVVWRDPRPAGCGPAPTEEARNAGLGLAADGPLVAASFTCGPRVVVQRLHPATGRPTWTWRSPSVGANVGQYLAVTSAALRGGVVLVTGAIGPPPAAQRFLSRFPHARAWPDVLGPNDAESTILALDAATGHPRWSELGGQLVTVAPTDAAVCEVVDVGAECRDDTTGAASMPILLTGRPQLSSPPYEDDGYAGVSAGLVAVTMPSHSGGVTLRVQRVRGGTVVAQVRLAIGATAYNGAKYDVFAIGAGPLGSTAILVLVRRIDLPGFPVLALQVPLPAAA
jgi:outer membrane protein assembly factor BamB